MIGATFAERLSGVRARIAAAAGRAGRMPEDIALVAVTKFVQVERIVEAADAGITHFGENYVREARSKQSDIRLKSPLLRWHLVGHLQSNKVNDAVGAFTLIQSVDSVALTRAIGRRASGAGLQVDILLQVKLDPAETKTGIPMSETARAVDEVQQIAGIRLTGLMGIAPAAQNPEASRSCYRTLRTVFEAIPPCARHVLSMGMTADFEVAIEEGANLVRIGTALFGTRSAM